MTTRKSKIDGMTESELNSDWLNEDHKIDRERILYRLARIEKHSEQKGYYGMNNCKLCNEFTTIGERSYGDITWPVNIDHYIEFHGHKPSPEEYKAIYFLFEEIDDRLKFEVQQGMKKKERQNISNKN